MLEIANAMKLVAALVAIGWVIAMFRRPATTLSVSWGVFCTAMSLVLLEEVFAGLLGRYALLVGIAGGATCSVFWLVSRALFRPDARIEPMHLLLVSGIFMPSVFSRLMRFFETDAVLGPANQAAFLNGLGNFQLLLSSTALVLSFAEGARAFSHYHGAERQLRLMFLSAFAVCVTVCVVLPLQTAFPPAVAAQSQAVCATLILAVASLAVRYRLKHPLPREPLPPARRSMPVEASEEDHALARRIERLMREDAVYLRPEVKVADVARLMMEPDYRVSRAVTAALGHPNFNRYINRYRIEHAQHLLATTDQPVITIAHDSGFASLGPFNRAFKQAAGMTPSEFRRQHLGDSTPKD